jgi:hypothetical protein
MHEKFIKINFYVVNFNQYMMKLSFVSISQHYHHLLHLIH